MVSGTTTQISDSIHQLLMVAPDIIDESLPMEERINSAEFFVDVANEIVDVHEEGVIMDHEYRFMNQMLVECIGVLTGIQ